MHLHAAYLFIETCDMFELLEAKVGIEFAIHSRQQVQIESRSHAQRIVISSD